MTHYLKIIFILSSLFFLSSSLATSSCLPSFSDVLPQPQNSVWKIVESKGGQGSGFFISRNQIVTNFHVLGGLLQDNSFDGVTVLQDKNPQKFKIKKIQKLSLLHDLAVLEIHGETKNYLKLQNKTPFSAKDLFVMGYPKGVFTKITTSGDFIYKNDFRYRIPTKYNYNLEGASGSPLLNKEGEVVGVFSTMNNKTISTIKINNLSNLLKKKTKPFSNSYEDIKKELKNLHEMAKQGLAEAQFRLGLIYIYKKNTEDDKLSFYWFQKAAEQGLVEAQFALGDLHLSGRGTVKNEKMGFYWTKKAAEQGLDEAQLRLGFMHLSGIGTVKNEKMAFYWFQKAAEQGLVEAQLELRK